MKTDAIILGMLLLLVLVGAWLLDHAFILVPVKPILIAIMFVFFGLLTYLKIRFGRKS